MSDLIALRLEGEDQITLIDRASGKVETVALEALGFSGTDSLPVGFEGVATAFLFRGRANISSRHRVKYA